MIITMNNHYENLSIEELEEAIKSLDSQIEYGDAMMRNCGYSLAYASAKTTQDECKKILAKKIAMRI